MFTKLVFPEPERPNKRDDSIVFQADFGAYLKIAKAFLNVNINHRLASEALVNRFYEPF